MSNSLSFASIVGDWCRETPRALNAVRNISIDRLGGVMTRTRGQGGRVPFDTGNLARSLLASTAGMPMTSTARSSGGNVGAVTATLRIDQPIWLGYQAVYARRMNYGFVGADSMGRVYNQSGNYFVEGAVLQWRSIVAQAARELQSSFESREI